MATTRKWQCPKCEYSVTPDEIAHASKHFDSHALECVRCKFRTESKSTWDEAIAAYNASPIETLDDFAKAIEANVRSMMSEQARLIDEAQKADLDPEHVIAIMNSIVAKVERETAAP